MKLICPECRRENEPERIYCHDCGARLDRTALRQEKPKEEDPQETQKRLRSMFDGRGALFRLRILQGIKVILGAFLIAVLIQMLRAPDLSAPQKDSIELPKQINLEMETAAEGRGGPALHYTEAQANDYLGYALKSKRKALSSYLQFEGAHVGFDEGSGRFTVERSLFGHGVFTTIGIIPKLSDAKLDATVISGAIGRMPIHPALMQYAGFLFSDVRGVLKSDLHSIAKLDAIELHPKEVIFVPRQPRP
ncbi:MAG: hypothetical protein ACR2NX_03945 [Chthoniobacterales bacterium]